MTQTIVQINFTYGMTDAEYAAVACHGAVAIADVPGLIWKLFLSNPEQQTAGGIYLFADRAAATAYVNGPIIGRLRQHPQITEMDVKLFDVLLAPTQITRGPLAAPAPA
jgi:hypothetical protein